MTAKFGSRSDAARRLAAALEGFAGRHPLVLAIPRGAVEIGAIVAQRLGGELDVVLVRKLRAPSNPELAVGAVDETGWTYVAEHAAEAGATPEYLEREIREQTELLRQRRALYTPSRPPIDPGGRIVIVVDDGIATGASMIAALHAAREKQPARLICAVPVAAVETLGKVKYYADELVCLETPLGFYAVGEFYRDFRQVDDNEVIRLLAGK
jgi:putative phosphoribosyl transferase